MRTTGTRNLLAVALFLIGGLATAQSPQSPQTPAPPATGAISGVVVDGATGSPMSDVIVSLQGGKVPAGYLTRLVSDARGRFAFVNLPDADTYQITTRKFGYFEGGFGRDGAPTDALRFIVVKNGEWAGNLRVPIWRPSSVSGSVRDERGEPVVGVFVRALVRIRLGGREDLAVGPMTVTDDRGLYRLSGLTSGRYVIQVPSVQVSVPSGTRVDVPRTGDAYGAVDTDDSTRLVIGRYPLPPPSVSGRAMAYPTAFHPVGSSVTEAATIELKVAEDRPGVDIALTPVAAARISGTVEGPPETLSGLTLRLLPAGLENLGLGAEAATALVASDGSFTFLNVPSGTYTLEAPYLFNELTFSPGPASSGSSVGFGPSRGLPNPPPSGSWGRSGSAVDGVPGVSLTTSDFRNGETPNYSGRTSVTVGAGNLTSVTLRLRPNIAVRGRFVIEADPAKPPPPTPPRFSASLDPAGGQARLGYPRSGRLPQGGPDEFEILGVQAGEYWLRAAGAGWMVKSVMLRGRDYALMPIDATAGEDLTGFVVTMTNAVPTLSGSVRTQDGSPPGSGIVIVFPAASSLHVNTGIAPTRLRSAPIHADGSFTISMLPAGDYFVAAVDRSRIATWRDPEYLMQVERQATRITLHWGQTVSQSLTMVGR